ncbi:MULTISPECIES: TniQ family protein [Mycobacterium]|nr:MULTISPECIES: TniQ family protein [Mycobacterium]MCA2247592.1 TniQ family protein [Mycobacterium intracellulare]MEA1157954.1 TniQ family protein [Mycobacterium europaeum]
MATAVEMSGARLGPRTLPLGIMPVPGEALESWLAALAQCLDLQWGKFLSVILPRSLVPRPHSLGRLDLTAHLTEAELRSISAATGVDAASIEALTWRRFDGLVGTVDVAQRQMKMSWPFRRFRFCPECVADSHGRWQLEWRLPWVFACQKHFRLLADSCPACGHTQRTSRGWLRGDLVPAPELCRATAPDGSRCGHLLSATSTSALTKGHPFLKAQAALSNILSDATVAAGLYGTMPASTKQFLADLRLLAMRFAEAIDPRERTVITSLHPGSDLVAVWDSVEVRRWRASPKTRRTVPALIAAVGITSALEVLLCRSVDEAATRMQPLLATRRQAGNSVYNGALTTRNRNPVIDAVTVRALRDSMGPLDQLRYRAWEPLPRWSRKLDASALRSIPTCLWSDWAIRLLPPDRRTGRRGATRAGLAMLLLAVGNRASEPEMAKNLAIARLAAKHAENPWIRVRLLLRDHGWWPNVATALTRLADHLADHPSPIDYATRRRLDYRKLLPDNDWREIFASTDFGNLDCAHTGQRVRNWMFERISMLPADMSPFTARNPEPAGHVLEPIELLAPPIADRLDTIASRFLQQHRIVDEPVAWSPPLSLVADLDLPGPDVEALNIEVLHQAILAGPRSISGAAEGMGVRPRVVRHLLERSPLPQPVCRGQQRPKKPTRLDRARLRLPGAELARLHEQKKWSLYAIGKYFGIDSDVVKQLAVEQGIVINLVSVLPKPVDAEWLYREYIVNERTMEDIALEVGISPWTLRARASELGIHKRRVTPPISEAWIYQEYMVNKRSLTDMALDAGVDRQVLARRAHNLGIPVRRNPPRRATSVITRERFYAEYVTKNRSLTDMERDFEVSHGTLRKLANGWGIPLRRSRQRQATLATQTGRTRSQRSDAERQSEKRPHVFNRRSQTR